MMRAAIVIGLSLVLLSCATKHYGRQGILSAYEKETMSCREIDLELAKVRGFIDHVNKESEFSGRDVLAGHIGRFWDRECNGKRCGH